MVEAISDLVEQTMGPRGKEFILIIGTLGLFILFNNLSGLVPGFLPATDNVNTTFACSLTVFVMTHFYGIREHGLKYVKHFMGPIWWLAPIMIPIELIGHLSRPLSLGLRLFGNIMGDHLVTGIFFMLIPLFVPLIGMLLGTFVSLVQAFVFMLLSMAYFSGAVAHEEL
jgi:F-type H+-transporting ATPase subunit a